MQPVLHLQLGGYQVAVASYTLFLAAGVAVTLLSGLAIAVGRGIPAWRALYCLLAAGVAFPVGARVLHLATNQRLYLREPERAFSLDTHGFALAGGLALAAAVGMGSCRLLSVNAGRLADSVAPGLGMGIALTRVGCYLAGCCFGQVTSLPWGVRFPFGSEAHLSQMYRGLDFFSGGPKPVHPTQLYELLAALEGALLAAWLLRRRLPDWTVALAFALGFSAFRLLNHPLRVPSPTLHTPDWFYPALYAAVTLVAGGLLFRVLRSRWGWRGPSRPRGSDLPAATVLVANTPPYSPGPNHEDTKSTKNHEDLFVHLRLLVPSWLRGRS